jgi:hypothetical protein
MAVHDIEHADRVDGRRNPALFLESTACVKPA